MAPNPYSRQCPTRLVLDRIADKWTVLILGLLRQRAWRFNALLREIEGLSQKVLSQTLKRMERDGLVHRAAFPTVPVTVEYSLSSLGETLAGSVNVLIEWSETHINAVVAAQQAYDARQSAAKQSGAR